jgi:DNA anti-recombination protein RmuC
MDEEEEIVDLARKLTEKVSVLPARIQRVRQQLEANQQQVIAAIGDRHQEILGLAGHMNGLSDLIEAADEELIDVVQPLEDIQQIIEASESDADDALEPLASAAADISEHMRQEMDNARESIDEFLEAQREALDAAVVQAGNELKESISGVLMQKIEQVFEELADEISEQAERLLEPLADEVANRVESLIEGITQDLARGDADTRRENGALETAIEALRPAVDDLLGEFKRVTALAEMVGM